MLAVPTGQMGSKVVPALISGVIKDNQSDSMYNMMTANNGAVGILNEYDSEVQSTESRPVFMRMSHSPRPRYIQEIERQTIISSCVQKSRLFPLFPPSCPVTRMHDLLLFWSVAVCFHY